MAAHFPLDPIWYRAIETGFKLGCLQDMIDIAVVSSGLKSIHLRPSDYKGYSGDALRCFQVHQSDSINLASAFNAYMRNRALSRIKDAPPLDLAEWCMMFSLDMRALEDARLKRIQLRSSLIKAGFSKNITRASLGDIDLVRKAIAVTFCTQIARHYSQDRYRTMHDDVFALLEPLSCLVGHGYEWVAFTSLEMSGGATYMKGVTAIKPEWFAVRPALMTYEDN